MEALKALIYLSCELPRRVEFGPFDVKLLISNQSPKRSHKVKSLLIIGQGWWRYFSVFTAESQSNIHVVCVIVQGGPGSLKVSTLSNV